MKKKILILFIFLFLINFVVAQPPFQVVDEGGLSILYPQYEYVVQNSTFSLMIHVLNDSTLLTNSTTQCNLDLYNSSGDETLTNMLEWEGDEFELDIASGNFSDLGVHAYYIECNTSTQTGAVSGSLIVNSLGEELNESKALNFNFSMIILLIFFFSALIGLFVFENPSGKLACYWIAHVLFIIGTFSMWQFNEGYAISYIGVAGIFKILFYVSITAMFPMVLLSIVWLFYIHTMNDDIKKFMGRGMDEEEAFQRARKKRKW